MHNINNNIADATLLWSNLVLSIFLLLFIKGILLFLNLSFIVPFMIPFWPFVTLPPIAVASPVTLPFIYTFPPIEVTSPFTVPFTYISDPILITSAFPLYLAEYIYFYLT